MRRLEPSAEAEGCFWAASLTILNGSWNVKRKALQRLPEDWKEAKAWPLSLGDGGRISPERNDEGKACAGKMLERSRLQPRETGNFRPCAYGYDLAWRVLFTGESEKRE